MQWAPPPRQRVLTIAAILAIVLGFIFLRPYFSVIIFAAILAFMMHPIYAWLLKKVKSSGAAASLTLLVGLFIFLIPIALVVFLSVIQVQHILHTISSSTSLNAIDASNVGNHVQDWVNNFLARFPSAPHITLDQVNEAITNTVTAVGQGFLHFITASLKSVPSIVTSFILFIYLFVNLLQHQAGLLNWLKNLNPLGNKAHGVYLKRMGDMTKAMVRGQFVIALCQGLAEAIVLYIAGMHGVFFFMFILLTVLSIIPLGGGIIAIPIGIIMIINGDIWQGVFVLAAHFLLITNIDNILRPHLVPKTAKLNSALTMLSVFAGIAMFGFLGVVIGPVLMIVIVTTLQMYADARAPEAEAAK